MGLYVNPGNQAFAEIADADYVDMTGMISLVSQTIGRKNKLTCISRPRRFGKSWAAKMLAAYYDCSCDSHALFDDRDIARTEDYGKYLNQFNVIYLDISGFVSAAGREGASLRDIPRMILSAVQKELEYMEADCNGSRKELELMEGDYSGRQKVSDLIDIDRSSGQKALRTWKKQEECQKQGMHAFDLEERMLQLAQAPDGRKFIFIIDEWDAVIREAKNDEEAQKRYLNLLRSWFKNSNFTPKAVAAAYMTGILPIKKDGTQSAISDFREYTMLNPRGYAAYTGFPEDVVASLCEKHGMAFREVKSWYDGYELSGLVSVYNPYSVMNALEEGTCHSFWGKTSAAEGLTDYIKLGFDGLQETVANLIAGAQISVNTTSFQNDLEHFQSRDDVLTLLVHLGYLTWDAPTGTVHIPNEEVRREFLNFLEEDDVGERWIRLVARSRKLLKDTLAGNEEAVAAALDEIRREQYAPQYYNNEQALRAIIKYAYLSAIGKYVKIEEMPSGKGLADVVFLSVPYSGLPAMVVELKWNKTAGGAISQIHDRHYTAALQPFSGHIVLVGVNYDEKTGEHTCRIEKA